MRRTAAGLAQQVQSMAVILSSVNAAPDHFILRTITELRGCKGLTSFLLRRRLRVVSGAFNALRLPAMEDIWSQGCTEGTFTRPQITERHGFSGAARVRTFGIQSLSPAMAAES